MTTTLLTLTLMFTAATPSTGYDSERAARLLIGADAPVSAPQARHQQLIEEKMQLTADMPDLGGPIAMMGASMGMGAIASLVWWGFAALGGLSSSGYELVLLTIPVMVIAILLTGGSVALGAVGTVLLAKRIQEINRADTRIGQIDDELRRGWPQGSTLPVR
jgi:hypothetical protein